MAIEPVLLTPEQREELLKKALIEKEIITQDQLNDILAYQQQLINEGKEKIGGTIFAIVQDQYKIVASDFVKRDELFSIDLPKPADMPALDWDKQGTDIALFDMETCKKVGDIPFTPEEQYGFIINNDKHYLYSPGIENQAHLGVFNNYFFGGIAKSKASGLPIDIFLSPSKKLMCLGDRAAGKVHIVDMVNKKLLGSPAVRAAGSVKAINVAIAENKKKVYVTDNQSSAITVIDLNNLKTDRHTVNFGILGNILVSPDEKGLYVIIIKPVHSLKLVDPERFAMQRDFQLKGDPFSANTDSPVDLMTFSPDNKNLLIMTYLNDPTPFLPIITVIDIPKQKTTQRFSIKDGTKPVSLGFAIENPIYANKKEFTEILLSRELITPEQLREINRSLTLEEKSKSETPSAGEEINIEHVALEFQQQHAEEDDDDEITLKPQKAPFMNISPAADDLISDICVGLFYQNTDVDLTEVPDAMARIKTAASAARRNLEYYDAAIIKISNLYEKKNLKTVTTREAVLEMLRQLEFDTLVKEGLKTIPKDCPNCDRPLLGSYVCRACGYELEKPEDTIMQGGVTKLASLDPLANLPRGHFLILDIAKARILEIDAKKSISWELSKTALFGEGVIELENPSHATRLKNRNTVVADSKTNRVVEITPKGRVFWEFDQYYTPEHVLEKPVRAAPLENRNIIVVDQGHHRVVEIDRDQFIKWQYGKMKEPGIEEGFLYLPGDVQRLANGNTLIVDSGNNRVIEVENNKIVWQYGNPENIFQGGEGDTPDLLSNPTGAYEFADTGNILILDSGNKRVLEVTREKILAWEYKTIDAEEEKDKINNPIKAIRLRNFNVLISGEQNLIEVEKGSNKVVWQCAITDLSVTRLFSVQEDTIKKAQVKHGTINPYMRMRAGAAVADDGKKEENLQDKIKALIEKQKEKLGQRPTASGDKAMVSLTPGAVLGEIEIALADRSRNRVIKADRKGFMKLKYGEGEEGGNLKHPHQAESLANNKILIADSDRFRVIEVDLSNNQIVWQYGTDDQKGIDKNFLGQARHATRLKNGNTLIADVNRIIEVTPDKEIVWTYRNWEVLNAPYFAVRLDNGNTLITDWGNHIVIEVTPSDEVVWQYGTAKKAGREHGQLMYPESAIRLPNGNTLICDTRNNRILEIIPEGEVAWEYFGEGLQKIAGPTYVQRLAENHTLIVHNNNRQIIEIDETGKLLWKYMLPFEKK